METHWAGAFVAIRWSVAFVAIRSVEWVLVSGSGVRGGGLRGLGHLKEKEQCGQDEDVQLAFFVEAGGWIFLGL